MLVEEGSALDGRDAELARRWAWGAPARLFHFSTQRMPDHAYRVLLLDAGHLGQTFHLVCTKLGLASFTSSAKSDTAIERYLGIDGISEISLYAAATGVPAD